MGIEIKPDGSGPMETIRGTEISGEGTNLIQRILRARGLIDPEEVARFCAPKLTYLHDPQGLPGVDPAVEMLAQALKDHRTIAIYGDYDVDGVTASSILYHTLKACDPNARLLTWIPHRLEEGYGLNAEAIKQLREQGADLLITVDCGITAVEESLVARSLGLDLIITDHHTPSIDGALPMDVPIVHPRLPGHDAYPNPNLCGAGVAYKIAWQLARHWCGSERVSKPFQKLLLDLLPFVALGTIADVMPLTGENRILTKYGLSLLAQSPFPGIHALIEVAGLAGQKLDGEHIGFRLAPRLNAVGRMGHAREALTLFTTESAEEAMDIARRLDQFNQERQKTEKRIAEQAMRMAEDTGQTDRDCRIIVLAHEDWHPGVVGIVCSRLVNRFCRPAILMQKGAEVCKGSGRSIDGFNLHEALAACDENLISSGGHAAAAGLSLETENLEAFTTAITAHANANIQPDQLTPSLTIDCSATLRELDQSTIREFEGLAPFGQGNRAPVIHIARMTIADQPRQMGANGRHLSFRVRDDSPDGNRSQLRAVWWSAGSRAVDLAPGMTIDLALQPKLNTWQGRTTVEAEIKDLRIVE